MSWLFRWMGTLSVLITLSHFHLVGADEDSRRPNVLFILADDLGWSDTTLYGTTKLYKTPNIERLATRGMTFSRAYSSSPLCSPTRASILTGQSPARHGITAPQCHLPDVRLQANTAKQAPPSKRRLDVSGVTRLPTSHITLAECLRDAGYRTGHFGKWHLGHEPYSPLEHGFEIDVPHWPGPGPAGSYVAPWKFPDFDPDTPKQHIEDRMAKEAVAFMKKHRDEPFFLNYWMFSVHAPFDAKADLIGKYRKVVDPSDPQRSPTYAAMIESMDDAVGTLLDALEELKLAENTIIIFASDNGGNMYNEVDGTTPTSNAPLRGGKATMFEGGVRGPCVVVWPGTVSVGAKSEQMIQSIDFYPTLLEMVGLKKPTEQILDGVSIVPALQGNSLQRDAIFTYFPHGPRVPDNLPPSVSVHSGDWKLIRVFHEGSNYVAGQPGGHRYLLFNLRDDPSESNNLISDNPSKVKQLDELIERYLHQCGAVIPLPNPRWSIGTPKTSADPLELGITRANQVEVSGDATFMELRSTGSDPYLVFAPLRKESDEEHVLELEYFSTSGLRNLQFRHGPDFRGSRVEVPDMSPAEGWRNWSFPISQWAPESLKTDVPQWRIDFGVEKDRRIRIRNLRLRPITAEEIRKRKDAERLRKKKASKTMELSRYYVQSRRPAQLQDIEIDGKHIAFSGMLRANVEKSRVAIVAREVSDFSSDAPSALDIGNAIDIEKVEPDGAFSVRIDASKWPNALSPGTRFQLIRKEPLQVISSCRFATHLDSKEQNELSPPPGLKGAKGLTCVTPRLSAEHLRELGLKHFSVNVSLAGLLSRRQRPGFAMVTIRGQKWFANTNRLLHLDQSVRMGTRLGAVAAGILLIPFQPPNFQPLVHPEATSAGTYAMPNLTRGSSVELYTATLDFLAKRYGRSDGAFGRIDHWIVHNEVDYGWQWTNMGEQPLELFMDHYIKSMRLVDHCMRRVNPYARSFISLTHRWNVPDDQPWRTYSPRKMLRYLIRCCEVEGDFPWGIAYHPYPQDLWNSATWNDRQVSNDLDTRLITIKNLPVLEEFVQSGFARMANGRVRPVILSEQGFHAPAGNALALDRQCAALLYTFRQIRKCPSFLAFDYHRPTDHPDEGGLMLGLRGLPSQRNQIGDEKPAWRVYRSIGTEGELTLMRQFEHHWKGAERQKKKP